MLVCLFVFTLNLLDSNLGLDNIREKMTILVGKHESWILGYFFPFFFVDFY